MLNRLILNNIRSIKDVELTFEKCAVRVTYGEPKETTAILYATNWLMGKTYPADILKSGANTGYIQLEYDDVVIRKDFYKSNGTTVNKRLYFRKG